MDEEAPAPAGVRRRDRDDHQDDAAARAGAAGAAAEDEGALRTPGHPGLHRGVALRRPRRAVGDRRADEPAALRDLGRNPARPTLKPGDIVIPDNLAAHKSEKAAALLKDRGAWFLFLPPHGPDLDPIEMAFAKLKARPRTAKARTIEAPWRAVGSIRDLCSPDECWNYLNHAGYVAD